MAMSGAMPDPPATRSNGPPSLASQVNQPLDHECEPPILGCGGYGVAALSLVAVFRREPDVHVLARFVPLPAGHIQDDALRVRRLGVGLHDLADAPGQPTSRPPGFSHLNPPSSAARARGRRSYGNPRTPRSRV